MAWRVPGGILRTANTPLLLGIDPYGDTIFNRPQVEELLPREVAYLRSQLEDPAELRMLEELERLMGVATARVHRYLWFLGD